VVANEAVVGIKVIDVAAEAVVANELDTAFCAQLLVPINSPANDPVNEPVLIWVELDTNPFGLPVMVSHVVTAPLT
jgi:hypothetical protein